MNKGIKKCFSFVCAFVVLFGFLFSNTVDCLASGFDFDSGSNLYLDILPYGGTPVKDVVELSTIWSCADDKFSIEGSLKYKNATLKADSIVESGKKYTYEGRLDYIGDNNNFNFNNYKLYFRDELDKSNTSFVKESSYKVVDSDTLEFNCIILITDKPCLNRGTLYADFSADKSYDYNDDTTTKIISFLSCLNDEGIIISTPDIDGNIVKSFSCDLDKNGRGDIICNFKTLNKSNTCSLSGEITYNLPANSIKNFENKCLFYYDKLVIKFSEKASASNNSSSNNSGKSSNGGSGASKGTSYKNEWVKGQWYDAKGGTSYTAKGSWKSNSKGWWFEDSKGWYPHSQWQKIDGKWYYFTADGYMDYSEYRDGYWLGADGAWDENYSHGKWHLDGTGWWYEDNGWYPHNQYLWIDGVKYWFNSSGYMS